MATCEDLDKESGFEKDDAEEGGNVVVGLVATEASEATLEVEPPSEAGPASDAES